MAAALRSSGSASKKQEGRLRLKLYSCEGRCNACHVIHHLAQTNKPRKKTRAHEVDRPTTHTRQVASILCPRLQILARNYSLQNAGLARLIGSSRSAACLLPKCLFRLILSTSHVPRIFASSFVIAALVFADDHTRVQCSKDVMSARLTDSLTWIEAQMPQLRSPTSRPPG